MEHILHTNYFAWLNVRTHTLHSRFNGYENYAVPVETGTRYQEHSNNYTMFSMRRRHVNTLKIVVDADSLRFGQLRVSAFRTKCFDIIGDTHRRRR